MFAVKVARGCAEVLSRKPFFLIVPLRRSYVHVQASDRTSSLLTNALDKKRQDAQGDDYVGPFQLGLIPPTPRNSEKVKKWADLSTSGKVARTATRTSNVAVILLGASLSAVLVYALTSELFSNNSATVLYGQACEKLKASPHLAHYLHGPLVFHNNPPSSIRPRHRNHQVSSQLVVDSQGREHMLMHFYVEGRPPGANALRESGSDSYLDSAVSWTKDTASCLSEMSLDDIIEKTKTHVAATTEKAKGLFRFLSGEPVPHSQEPEPPRDVKKAEEPRGWASGLTGLFSGIRGTTGTTSDGGRGLPDSRAFREGEVHIDLVMNDHGYFEFRYIFVDLPHSHSWNTKRVIVERADSVRDNEPVMSWHA